jgi:hypothetical protein
MHSLMMTQPVFCSKHIRVRFPGGRQGRDLEALGKYAGCVSLRMPDGSYTIVVGRVGLNCDNQEEVIRLVSEANMEPDASSNTFAC